jgi:hypothetical protein
MMKNYLLAAVLVCAGTLAACTETIGEYRVQRKSVNGMPVVTATSDQQTTAKVDAIDYAGRSIALTWQDGKTDIFNVTSDVRNFSQIKKGDTVKVLRHSQVVASLRKTTDEPTIEVIDSVMTAELGQKPGILAMHRARVEAVVEDVNYNTRDIKLKTTTGDKLEITASKMVPNFDKVKVGDQVVFTTTEAISITVQ